MERFILYDISPVEESLTSQNPRSFIISIPDLKPVSFSLIFGLSLFMDRNFSSSGFSIIFLRIFDSNSIAPSNLSLFFPISLYSFSISISTLSLKLYSSVDLLRLFQDLITEIFKLVLSPCFLRISWYLHGNFVNQERGLHFDDINSGSSLFQEAIRLTESPLMLIHKIMDDYRSPQAVTVSAKKDYLLIGGKGFLETL